MPHDPEDRLPEVPELDPIPEATDSWPLTEHLPILTILHATLSTPEGEAWLDLPSVPTPTGLKA